MPEPDMPMSTPDSLEGFKMTELGPLPEDWEVTRLIQILREHLPAISERYKVKALAVFGSYVHNEQKQGSDLDLLVEFYETPGIFGYIDLQDYLSNLLGVKVDLVMKSALKPAIGRNILKEAVPI
jgi:uncharacterized protein